VEIEVGVVSSRVYFFYSLPCILFGGSVSPKLRQETGSAETFTMAANVVDLAKYDITRKMAPFLDPHFMFPILKWLRERNIYSEAEVLAAEYDLASNTSTMFTYLQELHKHLVDTVKATGGDVSKVPSPDFNTSALEAEFKQHMDAGGKVWELLGDKAVIDKLREAGKFTLEGLVEEGATEEEIESIFDLARFYHKGGLYKQALECVVLFRKVGPRFDSYRYFSTMWAQLAECICMILNPDTPSTKKPLSSAGGSEPSDFAFRVLRDTVEKRTMLGVQEVEHRRWLLHWALFVIFSRPRAHDELFDLFFSQREARSEQRTRKNDYLAITQAVSPWLLRYVAYATVLNFQNLGKRQRQFINVLKAEKATYSGPMTQLFVSLFSECDIEGSIAAIRESADVIRADFFLGNLAAKARGSVDDVINDFQSAALKLGRFYCHSSVTGCRMLALFVAVAPMMISTCPNHPCGYLLYTIDSRT